MVVTSTLGSKVSLVNTDKRCLYDDAGVKWERYHEMDCQDPYRLAYRETKANIAVIQLTREEVKRTINGVHAMLTPTTVEEMRYHALTLPKEYQWVINEWPDRRLQEILIEAEEKRQNPGAMLEAKAHAAMEEQGRTESHEEATGRAGKARSTPKGYSSTPRQKTQEGSVSVAFGDTSVTLTPKQLEFMERLSECPGWKETGTGGEYTASQYAEELSDTMNPMSMGAVLTTLREKGLLSTKKTHMGGIKCCMFKLTKIGVGVYDKLAGSRK